MLVLLLACRPPTPVPTETDPPTESAHTGRSDTGPLEWDCDALPSGPLELTPVPGARANEDLTFHDGALIGGDADTNLWRAHRDGSSELIRVGTGYHAGLRRLLDGDLVAASYETGSVDRVDPVTGQASQLVGGLAFPNGIEIGWDGRIYVSEWGGGRILRIDPDTAAVEVLATGLFRPNGLTFDVGYTGLWIAENTPGNDLSWMPIHADGTPGPVEPRFATGFVGVDGLAVDACDNLYILSYTHERIRRWDGVAVVDLVDRGQTGFGLGNLAWGDPAGGWDPLRGHVVWYGADQVLSFDLAVPEKPRPPPL